MPSDITAHPTLPQHKTADFLAQLEPLRSRATFTALRKREVALEEAAQIEMAGPADKPLYGMLFAVKDNIDVQGIPTTAGCPAFAYVPQHSATVVERLQQAGAILVGKTNMEQFATGLTGVRSPFGIAPNALRTDLVPGGSSSGSAVAVARGLVDFSLGTDTAGSGRIPAGMNGIVGLKPSLGLVSSRGVVPACRTLDTVSIFARETSLAFKVLQVIGAFDEDDPFSRRYDALFPNVLPPRLKAGVPRKDQRQFFGDQAAEAAFDADLKLLSALGFEVVEIDFEPFHAVSRMLYEGPWVAERYAAIRTFIESNPSALLPVTFGIISGATTISAADAFDALYRLKAEARRVEPVLDALDCLVVPTIPRFYKIADIADEPLLYNTNLGTYASFVNLLDLAAISVPSTTRGDGLPASITFVGRAGTDSLLAAMAERLEAGRRSA
ncbi:allophanate hydrolase [Rhizobium sp. SSA_523]|uniref:allophanate hydrolase n=1 Tax=Rhizobium sp. SSA_523 TaxID=2952477 RepID=UPI0020918DB3|nr:allophanate hydrolase [Rhizobium sp. SSA_523]MCO5732267.1 allophanate hydrolase [Rhizobium sp. SSA_523]WKC21328.1 allophanate hydrolase [Rhizobium sp. SSA_523]